MSSNEYGSEYDEGFDNADILRMHRHNERRFKVFRTAIVVITTVIVVVVAGVAFRNWRGGSGTNQAQLYAQNVEKVSQARADMSSALNGSEKPVELLTKYISNSESVDDLVKLRTQSQRLLDDVPSYYTSEPHTQSQYVQANSDLETYSNRLVNLTSQITESLKTAGQGNVENGVNTAMGALNAQVTAATTLMSAYTGQTATSQATITEGYLAALNKAMGQAQADLSAYKEDDPPYQLLEYQQTFEADTSDLSGAVDSMRKAFAGSQSAGGVAGNAQLAVSNKQVPSGLRHTWEVAGDDSITVTFTATTIDIKDGSQTSSTAKSTSTTAKSVHADYALAPGQRTDFGGTPIAAWTLTGVGSDKIDDTTIVLYQIGDGADGSSVFLGLYKNGASWKLTTSDSTTALINKY